MHAPAAVVEPLIAASIIWVAAVENMLGRVRLWGQVVEAEDGWRGERAYPDALYLLEESEHPLAPGHEGLSTDEILAALEPYGVPLELVPAGSLLDLAGRAA